MAESREINVDEMRRRARRRLVGAVVLALFAAVVVPMLFETDPKPLGEDVLVRIPPVDDGKFVNRLTEKGKGEGANAPAPKGDAAKGESVAGSGTVPAPRKTLAQAEQKVLSAPGAGAAAPHAAPAPAAPPPSTPPNAAPAGAMPAAPATSAAAPPAVAAAAVPTTPATAAPADAAAPAFSVQLAAFADDKGANALANKLKKAGYPAYTEPLSTSKGTLWRVRVGPYPAREDAIDIRNKLKTEGYSGIVAAK